MSTTSDKKETDAQAVRDAISTECPSGNEALKAKYDQMHSQGSSAWFNDGKEERELILEMGQPWTGLRVLEIGCGEGELAQKMVDSGASVVGIDYSKTAIEKARERFFGPLFVDACWSDIVGEFDRVVMQGVLEHLDHPFSSLKTMAEQFKPKSIITSSPCFLNPRGIVWMTLDMLGAVMSKTDLHFLNPWEFFDFCKERGYLVEQSYCDCESGGGYTTVADLKQRIPLALRDGNMQFTKEKLENYLEWLLTALPWMPRSLGATAVYRIDL